MMMRSTDITGVNIVETTKMARTAIAPAIDSQKRLANLDIFDSSNSSLALLGLSANCLADFGLDCLCFRAFDSLTRMREDAFGLLLAC